MQADFARWFEDTDAGRYTALRECAFFEHALLSLRADYVVQYGMADWLLYPNRICVGKDVFMGISATAWAKESLDLLLMPHTLECCNSPQLALAEAYRALKNEGRLVLTGFNPHSLWRFNDRLNGEDLPDKSNCLALPQLKRYLKTQGFAIEQGRFLVYTPPVNSERALKFWRFLESAGDRWWPHAAAVYGLVLVKRSAGVHLLPEIEQVECEEKNMILGVAALKE